MKILLFILLIFLSNDKAREANKAYSDGDFDRAVELYNEALQENPADTRVMFNLANALAKAGRPEDAAMVFDKYRSLAQSAEEKALGEYSMGRSFADMNDWGKAAEHFRQSLMNNPNDDDARYNYELALKKKQEQEEQKQDQQQNQDQNKDDEQKQDQQQQPQDNQDKEQEQQPQNQEQQQDQPEQPEQNPQEQPKPDQIDKQQAEKILEALENKEEDLLKELKKKKTDNKKTNRNDW